MTAETVTSGAIFLREGVLLPQEIRVNARKYSGEWQSLPGASGYVLDRQLRLLGWSCSFLAGELTTMSLARTQASMLERAVRKFLAKAQGRYCNCAEIATITRARFLGIPYLKVRGHARHVQPGFQLDGTAQRRKQQQGIDWASE